MNKADKNVFMEKYSMYIHWNETIFSKKKIPNKFLSAFFEIIPNIKITQR